MYEAKETGFRRERKTASFTKNAVSPLSPQQGRKLPQPMRLPAVPSAKSLMWTLTGNFKPLDSEVPKSEPATGMKPSGDQETRALAPELATEISNRSVWSGAGTHTAQFSMARRSCPVAPAPSPPPKTRSPGKNSRTQASQARFPVLTLAFCWGECPPTQGPPPYPWLGFLV